MTIDFQMFGSLMEHWIGGYVNCTLTVTILLEQNVFNITSSKFWW